MATRDEGRKRDGFDTLLTEDHASTEDHQDDFAVSGSIGIFSRGYARHVDFGLGRLLARHSALAKRGSKE